MSDLSFTLVSDGPTDRALIRPLLWLLEQHSSKVFKAEWPDLRKLRSPPRSLRDRISAALELAPCDLLFIHRDAERESPATRAAEVAEALAEVSHGAAIPVVPVRMTEAWFLWNERAIRRASGNPRGRDALTLPAPKRVEEVRDPKTDLREALAVAGGRAEDRSAYRSAALLRVAEEIEDYAPLRAASAFASLEADVRRVVADNQWG